MWFLNNSWKIARSIDREMQLRPLTAARADLIEKTRAQNYPEWGPPLTLEQYQRREARLEAVWPSAPDPVLTCWALMDADAKDQDKKSNELEIHAHLETYRRPIRIWLPDNKDAISAYSAGVASVFVRPDQRNRGLGTQMMRALKEQLHAADPEMLASHLYSDIGEQYYSRLGWEARTRYISRSCTKYSLNIL